MKNPHDLGTLIKWEELRYLKLSEKLKAACTTEGVVILNFKGHLLKGFVCLVKVCLLLLFMLSCT